VCLFINDSSLFANCYRPAGMALLGRNEFDAAVAVLVAIPIHKSGNPLAVLALVVHARLVGLTPIVVA